MMYQGFTTAICLSCQGVDVPEAVEESDIAVLYTESPEQEKIGLAKSVFRALGFGRPKPPKAPAAKSKAISKEKKRKPIFESEDTE